MTDPQNDVPCRDCKRPTQHATEICDDCRTPAGRLVTALLERGIESETSDHTDGAIVSGLFVDAVDCGWGISGNCDDLDGNIEAAANAIAAIVDHAGTIATLAAEVKRLTARVLELEAPGECQSLHKLRAERDRRIDPVEHARAVRDVYISWALLLLEDKPKRRDLASASWLSCAYRANLLALVGADVLAEVER